MTFGRTRSHLVALVVAALLAGTACAGIKPSDTTGAGGGGGGASTGAGGGGVRPPGTGGTGVVIPPAGDCVNLQCQQTTCTRGPCTQHACAGDAKTTLSGKIFDPAGNVALYNVVVYVPNEALAAINTGPSCDSCESPTSGHPIAATLTDASGAFTMDNVPVGDNIPVVIQVGKWRRQVTVAHTTACTDTVFSDTSQTRLPRNQSEGHIPRIAIATGGSDALECLVRKIGVDQGEFTLESGSGRVNLFAGTAAGTTLGVGGPKLPTAPSLYDDGAKLMGYDLLLLSCEGTDNNSRSMAEHQNVQAFADAGGRIFGSHFHNIWVHEGLGTWPTVAKFASGAHGFTTDITNMIDTSFPKGVAFGQWLSNVGATPTPGRLVIKGAEHTIDASVPPLSQRWIYGTDMDRNTPMVQYLTFNTPVPSLPIPTPAPKQCGRMVLSDLHVASGTGDSGKVPFPSGCVSTTLTPQEKALEFMIFDLSSCVTTDDKPPQPPVIIP
jgi:hypothetical protein